jgi:glycosyltransferase involved in cell wall biosynthesis
MKKILCLVPYTYLPAKSGGQKLIASFYMNLSKHFSIICIGTKANDETNAEYEMINILSNSFVRYINPFLFFKIKKIINKEKPDYFQLEHPYLGWLAVFIKRTTGIKLIVRSHNIEGLRFKNLGKWWWKILLKYEGWVHRNSDINYFITEEDKLYAIKNFKLSPPRCYTITSGIDQKAPPTAAEKVDAHSFILNAHRLHSADLLILFNGAFNYAPNRNALYHLVQKIFPLVKSLTTKSFKLIVCGSDMPGELINENKDADIIFAGFVPDINVYLKGSNIFVNPITEGGGIKTKLVEALGFDLTCISFVTGAIGVSKEVCGEKLIFVEDNNYQKFAEAIINNANLNATIPDIFYEQFSNEGIMGKIKNIL